MNNPIQKYLPQLSRVELWEAGGCYFRDRALCVHHIQRRGLSSPHPQDAGYPESPGKVTAYEDAQGNLLQVSISSVRTGDDYEKGLLADSAEYYEKMARLARGAAE